MSQNIDWFYSNREERSKWLVERFDDYFNNIESILDVGCWQRGIKEHINENVRYFGIDIAGKPDKVIDLDKTERLPFSDEEFDMVLCSDVLEHLENIHFIFDELLRVSSKYVVITLPIATKYSHLKNLITRKEYSKTIEQRKKFGKYSKFYGLPLEVPEDRHRWFFGYDESVEFVEYRAKKGSFSVDVLDVDLNYRKGKGKLISNFLKIFNENLSVSTAIFLLKKNK